MNQKQKDYAIDRIRSLFDRKRTEIVNKYTTEAIILSKEEKIDLIIAGKVSLIRNKSVLRRSYSGEGWFDFSSYERNRSTDNDAVDKELNPIRKLRTKANDEIMLGDSEEALRIIREFEASLK